MNARLSFGVVGCGMLARHMHIPTIAHSPKTLLHTCCDLSDEALALCRKNFAPKRVCKDYREVIADPEVQAICLATNPNLRLPVIQAALEAGKPVYCEKPLANTLEEMYAIQEVVRKTRVPFCVGHNRRSSPAMQAAHKIFRAHMTNPQPCPWRFDREKERRPQLAGDGVAGMSVRINDDWYSWKLHSFDKQANPHGPMLFEMSHFTDLCNWFLQAEPVEVTALESSMLNHGTVIRYRTGELATLLLAANGTFGYPKELYEMFGNGAAVVVDHMLEIRTAGIEGAPAQQVFPMVEDRHPNIGREGGLSGWLAKKRQACKEAAEKGDPMLIFTAEPDKGHVQAIERFVDEIRREGPVVCSVDEAVMATRVCFAALRSTEQRRPVALKEL